MVNLDDYVDSFLDPFDPTVKKPKIFDGRFRRSLATRLRASTSLTCSTTTPTYIAFFPGLSNSVSFDKEGVVTPMEAYPQHLSEAATREVVQRARIVSSGLKLSLVNSADQNEGYWEAIRLNFVQSNFSIDALAEDGVATLTSHDIPNLPNYPTYQTGKLRDIHRFMFKLNIDSKDKSYTDVVEPPTLQSSFDHDYDIVLIKISGRQEASSPSVLKLDVISNQEIVCKEDSALGRAMTESSYSQFTERTLQKTDFKKPAVQMF